MSLSARYQRFLASPSADALTDHASLNYITTLTSIKEPAAIIKHLATQAKQLEKKSEKVLSAIESGNGLCIDVETTIEFVSSGGAYLPGLDDNFLADRAVTFPSVHIVKFDDDQKITQIRLYWDQGSLLKQIDVIGARARNWPIRDGKDMIRLISSSATTAGEDKAAAPATDGDGERATRSTRGPSISSKRSSVSATSEARTSTAAAESTTTVSPRPSAKPAPRGLAEILASGEEGEVEDLDEVEESPVKTTVRVKAGAGKNFRPNRLFDKETEETPTQSPQKTNVKTNPHKYNHFEFGEGEDAGPLKQRPTTTTGKHQSQWGFEDFVTPKKVAVKVRGQDVRHFGWSDDEDTESPVRRPVVHQPRPDAKAHFEFVDDGTPKEKKPAPSKKGLLHNKGLGLYKDHVLGDEDTPAAKKPLANVTGHAINNDNRRKDFDANWEMVDQSPTTAHAPVKEKKLPEDKTKDLKALDSHWSLFDENPAQSKKENVPAGKGIKTAGNGMGGRKDGYNFAIGAEDEEQPAAPATRGRSQKPADKSFWDF